MTARRASWLALPAAVALALGAGALVTYLQDPVYEARATIVVTRAKALVGTRNQVAATLAALLRSDIVAANTVSTLRLDESARELRSHLDVDVDPSALLLKLRVREHDAERARAVAAEVAAVFAQQVRSRFPGSGLDARILDGAHANGRVSPRPARDLAISGAAGLAVGAAALVALRRRRPPSPDLAPELERRDGELASLRRRLADLERERDDAVRRARADREARDEQLAGALELAEREERLAERVRAVTQRELALARRAGGVQARARSLEEREAGLAARARSLEERDAGLAAREREAAAAETERRQRQEEQERELQQAREEAAAAAAAVPEPAPEPPPARVAAGDGAFRLDTLVRLVETHRQEFPEQAEEWQTYLFFLREHADASGRLPASFDHLVDDVFADLLQ